MSASRRAPRLLRLLLVLASAGALAGIDGRAGLAQERTPGAQAARRKALFIEQFTRLIDWPAAKLPPGGRFVLCLLGSSETGTELVKLAGARRFKERAVEARRLAPESAADLSACHLIYLAGSAAARVAQVVAAVAGQPILTVGDTAGFAARGVYFNLFEETRGADQGRFVNFEVNVPAVKRSVLAFDAQLLSHGRKLDGAPPAPTPPERRP
jgi:hypothetical protein